MCDNVDMGEVLGPLEFIRTLSSYDKLCPAIFFFKVVILVENTG